MEDEKQHHSRMIRSNDEKEEEQLEDKDEKKMFELRGDNEENRSRLDKTAKGGERKRG